FADITGVDKRTLLASEVIIHGRKDVYGVVSCQPPHLQTEEEAKKTVSLDKLVIDIGFSEEKAKELVSVGDVISQKSKCIELMNDQVSGKAFDDRAAVSAIIKAFENLQKTQLPYNLVMVASAQEETGCRGARTATYRVAPDEAIALDVSFAYTPDASKEDTGELNKGPMISYAATIKRELFKSLQTIAKAKKIPYQLEIMSATSGTNTDKIQLSRDGVAAGLISIPLKYMHTGIETLSLKDLENTAKLLTAYALSKKEEWADA
ncbi:MAG: M20/M25/M40 family metallo-hydrolase, partial [Bacillota bacterium]|nr:M20/M25/M40 family metallo-hydrolase [Bacillota bacterium]